MEVLKENIRKMKLQPVPWFIGKIIQVGALGSCGIYRYTCCNRT